jgi:hypothetical protein
MFFELEDVITGGATGEQQRGAAEGERECSLPDRDWTMPYPVTCACLMSAEMLLFVGLHDGSTIIWDCHLVTQVRVCSMVDVQRNKTLLVKILFCSLTCCRTRHVFEGSLFDADRNTSTLRRGNLRGRGTASALGRICME